MRWPPIIEEGGLPRWARVRDIVLTLLAWCLILYLILDPALILGQRLLGLIGLAEPVDPGVRRRLAVEGRPFLLMSALLSIWLVAFALLRRKVLANTRRSKIAPEPLDPQRHAAHFGLDATRLAALRQARGTTVDVDRDGDIVRISHAPDATG